MDRIRRYVALVIAITGVVALAGAPVAAAPLVREAYQWSDAGTWDSCGIELEYEAWGSGLFMLKEGRAGDPTPYYYDNYEWHWVNRNPANGKYFLEDGNGLYKDLRIVKVMGTVYRFEAIEAGRPYTITDMDGRRVQWDMGLLKYQFDVDTKGDDFLDNDEHLTFELVADRGDHPLWYLDVDGYCALVQELVG